MLSKQQLLLLAALCASLLTAAQAQFSWSEVSNQAALQKGDGTFYGAGQDSQGTCSFSANFANTNDLAWTTGAALTLALNDAQFDNSAACGLCVMYRGTGAGLGTTPIPTTYTLGFVNNRCPECAKGDLDQATSGDGRWKVEWYAVPCNVGSTPLVYSIVVSSYYWFSMVVSNTRYPITSVEANIGGGWLPLKRTNNNQWAYYNTNGPWQANFPMPVRVTSCLGETVEDKITDFSGNTGTVQFSLSGSGGGMPASGGSSNSTATAPAYPGSLSPTPPAVAPPSLAPASATPAVPPAVAGPANSLPTPDSFFIENYQQCGGNGGYCSSLPYSGAPCDDVAWPKAVCRSSGFQCTRYDASLWSCIPNNNITYPPPMVWTASPTPAPPAPVTATAPTTDATSAARVAAVATPPAVPATPPAVPATPPALPATPPAVPATPPALPATPPAVPATPPAVPATPPAVPASPPVVTASPPQAEAAPASPPSPTATAAATTTTTSTNSFLISNGSQCGGTSQCSQPGVATDKVTCNNGPWAGAYCNEGYTCQADPGPLIWSCKPANVATGGRRLLGSS